MPVMMALPSSKQLKIAGATASGQSSNTRRAAVDGSPGEGEIVLLPARIGATHHRQTHHLGTYPTQTIMGIDAVSWAMKQIIQVGQKADADDGHQMVWRASK